MGISQLSNESSSTSALVGRMRYSDREEWETAEARWVDRMHGI